MPPQSKADNALLDFIKEKKAEFFQHLLETNAENMQPKKLHETFIEWLESNSDQKEKVEAVKKKPAINLNLPRDLRTASTNFHQLAAQKNDQVGELAEITAQLAINDRHVTIRRKKCPPRLSQMPSPQHLQQQQLEKTPFFLIGLKAKNPSNLQKLCHASQTTPQPFAMAISNFDPDKISKLGEGSFGEAYSCYDIQKKKEVIIKIIPFEADDAVTEYHEAISSAESVLMEVVKNMVLVDLENIESPNSCKTFAQMLNFQLAVGKFPAPLFKAWQKFHETSGESQNASPEIYANANTRFAIISMEHCGQELEKFRFQNSSQKLSAMKQLIAAAAVLEEASDGEHRDYHPSNVMLCFSNAKEVEFKLNEKIFRMDSCGVIVKIIDPGNMRIVKDGFVFSNDLTSIVEQNEGNEESEEDVIDYASHHHIYSQMAEAIGLDDSGKIKWEESCKETNILWMKFLVDYLMHMKKPESKAVNEAFKEIKEQIAVSKTAYQLFTKLQHFYK